ncbi:sigma factor [Streptomyces sp. NPDC002668]|uniref:sigma factor n=1 Tax=Streptomyces sp. NPDC002668 TaxID=3154422 RepID=UPI00331C32E4
MRAISTVEEVALLRFAKTLTLGDVHSAEDLVQEALLRAWRHADRLISTEGLARPWSSPWCGGWPSTGSGPVAHVRSS